MTAREITAVRLRARAKEMRWMAASALDADRMHECLKLASYFDRCAAEEEASGGVRAV